MRLQTAAIALLDKFTNLLQHLLVGLTNGIQPVTTLLGQQSQSFPRETCGYMT